MLWREGSFLIIFNGKKTWENNGKYGKKNNTNHGLFVLVCFFSTFLLKKTSKHVKQPCFSR